MVRRRNDGCWLYSDTMDDPCMFCLGGLVVTGSRCLAVVTTTHFVKSSLLIEIKRASCDLNLMLDLVGYPIVTDCSLSIRFIVYPFAEEPNITWDSSDLKVLPIQIAPIRRHIPPV